MRIAVTYENGEIFQHFGRTPVFAFYDVEDGKVVKKEEVETGEYSHGALADFLKEHGAEKLICGGYGLGAKEKLDAAGIESFGGASGNADQAVADYLAGKLVYDPLAAEHHGPCHH